MKKLLIVGCFIAFLIGCKSSTVVINNDNPSENLIPKPTKSDVILPSPKTTDKSNYAILKNIEFSLQYLASDELEGRNTGSEGIEKAAVFIENQFNQNNIKPYFETYRDSFNIEKIIGYNIVGFIEGNDPELKNEIVILGAHYDHIGTAEEIEGDVVANGANDDASGTVAVMEWAKYFAKTKSNKRTVLFTLYAAEEMGLKGSGHLAELLKAKNMDLYTMINFEMIGVPRADSELMAYITGFDLSNMPAKLNAYANEEIVGFLPQAKAYNLFQRSDNFPFYNAFKIPAHAISTFDFTNFDYYHHVDDEADKMDFNHMTSFINKMIPALEGMINAPTKEIKMNNE
ncbi:M20/M25/M40 family metallo-hydrolase [Algibacter sp.]|uniref:M20/M25/M40 family metallo-hydrolase n=1 Tax=Algibacter sp. TaxID=1872428 RepID=UPI003C744DA2